VNDQPDLMVTLIKMQAKTNEKLDQYNQRIKQLEYILHSQDFVRPSTAS